MNPRKIIYFVIVLCILIINFFLGKFSISIPDGLEYKHWVEQYLDNKGMLVKSLNTELDTVYFYSLHWTGLKTQSQTYNPRFPWSIILFSIYSWIIWSSDFLSILITILCVCSSVSIWLIIIQWNSKEKIITTGLFGGIPLYMIYWGAIFDMIIPYFLVFFGHYLILKRKKFKYIWHFLFIVSCWYRYEFLLLYLIHGLSFQKVKDKILHGLGILIAFLLILWLQTFYKSELWISRDNMGYVIWTYQEETAKDEFKNLQKNLAKKYNDFAYENFNGIEIDSQSIEDNDSSVLSLAKRYLRLNKESFYMRGFHFYYLIVRASFLCLFFTLWWLIFFKKVNYKNTDIRIITVITLYILLTYSGSPAYYWFNRDVPYSSFIRYAVGLLILMGAIGYHSMIKFRQKINSMLIIFISVMFVIKTLWQLNTIYIWLIKYRDSAIQFEKQNNLNKEKTVWVARGDEKKAIFPYNPNIYSYESILDGFLEVEINKLLTKSKEKWYTVLFAKSNAKSNNDEEIQNLLDKYFSTATIINGAKFYIAK